jgi:hypothetical protein
MRDMNDMWVNDNCQTRIHSHGYVFTIEELMNIAICSLNYDELEKHEENNYDDYVTSRAQGAKTFNF